MDKMAQYTFLAGLIGVTLASLLYIVHAFGARRRVVAAAGAAASTSDAALGTSTQVGGYASTLAALSCAFLTLSLIFRTIATGHGPFSNMFEFSVAFAWGIVASYLYFERRYRLQALGALVMPVAAGMLFYAWSVPAQIQPLMPALQNNLLLSVHVAVAIVAYGTFTVAFGAAALYLYQRGYGRPWLPSTESLDEIGYRAVIIGFPFMALVIILGAIWADVAWGSYWSWDPKETASLVTWLIYGGYLHARTVRGWRGTRSAVLLLIGFAATLFTYFGNLFFGGLHSYAGV
jgi:ABC-type transport system involved in cytochrome c biogenesis permease subunit